MNAPTRILPPQGIKDLDDPSGPPLIAYLVAGQPITGETDWHHHLRGQFMYVESGMACVRTHTGVWPVTPHRVSWMPPGIQHTVRIIDPITGWGVWVAPEATAELPAKPSVLRSNELMHSLVLRAVEWADQHRLNDAQQRLMDVLMDEMCHAHEPENPITLPMPDDRRLLRVAEALLAHPGDTRTRDEWANSAGLSTRSLTRRFRDETGLSFMQWRQQARLGHALEQLGQGTAVTLVADAMGYASVSAFVAMFRRSMGQSPGKYLSLDPA